MIVGTTNGLFFVSDLVEEIEMLVQLATVILHDHINVNGRCAACADVAFPCDPALLAERAVALWW